MTEDGDKDRTEDQDSSRPVSASARRERRESAGSTAKPAGKRSDAGKKSAKGGDAAAPKSKSGDVKDNTPRSARTREDKEKRPSLFARLARFFREVVGELRKVIWPTKKQMITYTIVVLVFVAFMVTLVAGLDLAFSRGVLWLFG
ncbi:protein translocase subunit secE/sec61 gamma [Tamaricihabitans halophyticus]|uniref:Protein translocase subunit SecE n=1 Tax=Tamaricihabitans halophyticus TaxID=1262583 RepID=A0A4R2R182_9PSEU|nr:preprotein translocase subunit SecE [Tamaricihabitans halophyticus]TCP53175.1 protein translocase subunit secE/sec61 gamma [Tamaricihabitans halophyticus]